MDTLDIVKKIDDLIYEISLLSKKEFTKILRFGCFVIVSKLTNGDIFEFDSVLNRNDFNLLCNYYNEKIIILKKQNEKLSKSNP